MFWHTLIGNAIGWYHSLPMESIHSYKELAKTFRWCSATEDGKERTQAYC